jgi:hypothetical protein
VAEGPEALETAARRRDRVLEWVMKGRKSVLSFSRESDGSFWKDTELNKVTAERDEAREKWTKVEAALDSSINWERVVSRAAMYDAERARAERAEDLASWTARCLDSRDVVGSPQREAVDEVIAAERARLDALQARADTACENLRKENLRAEKYREALAYVSINGRCAYDPSGRATCTPGLAHAPMCGVCFARSTLAADPPEVK